MIITRLKIDNLYGFQDFELDLTYPRKQPQSFVDYEYLEDVPSFKFKRVCILMGTNASGKTSLGKVIWGIQTYINRNLSRLPIQLYEAICDKRKSAQIEIEFVIPDLNIFQYIFIEFKEQEITNKKEYQIKLLPNDTNLTVQKRLKQKKSEPIDLNNSSNDILSLLNQTQMTKTFTAPFSYKFVKNDNNRFQLGSTLNSNNLNKLLPILQTFDTTIVDVSPLITEKKDGESIFEGYTVFFENGDTVKVTDDGETFTEREKNRFSKGTYDVLSVADFILRILKNVNTSSSATYFLDEKLASSHSELEMTILNLIIQKLNKHSQFFYTTHNYDVLDLNLPAHSFVFLHKENGYCQAEQPEKLGFSKNDRKLKGYVRNNYFRTVPSTHLLDELMWGEDDE
ncbi:AAA family ATPase [Alysiella filiformis]|uniref:AAA domain-containing protein, putative AbiEii toxin, Type IV TA system n=1 Tax=Alysiella filiformis DSM 16848 TaxID=1120981 RepID=A0A286E743_9NEIS|nr:AAA family ATPase [Alysiella filiformis]QMT31569.1 ATP-binding protein [Alysiella filiformis]UBQ55418.1 ATP-binding protein [Alysiella filiformis DSM 16848]SOD66716.1 AAA domain-containing protein, putative AbiEii toxin, Type IV TA system [Alysiella filiformis DSM 16848]